MYLKRLYIRNFRSIKELHVIFLPGKNVIIGRNNSGKSNIIKAIDIILGQNNPTFSKAENITENDFYSWKENDDGKLVPKQSNEINIWCELERGEKEELNYADMYKCPGFFVRGDHNKPNRVSKGLVKDLFQPIFNLKEETEFRFYVNPKNPLDQHLENQFDNMFHFAFAFKATLDLEGNIEKDIRFLYRENDAQDWVLSFRATIRNEFLQSAIIPSFRDPSNQLRPVAWSWYGKLMKYLTDKHTKSDALQIAFDKVNEASQGIFSEVTKNVKETCIDVAFPGTDLHFQFVADKKIDLFKSCQIYIDDGFKSQLTEKGSGIQSATIIGLFNYYTKYVNTVSSALLCIEEPEIYLHPHGRRVISTRLDNFMDGNRNQVILTTHSEEFIKSGETDLNVILIDKNSAGTIAKPINLRKYKKLLFNTKQNEIFFAEKVIVCEGFDEYVIKSIAGELFPGKLDEKNVSVVSVDGKDNISSMIKLILQMGVKCYACTDFDYLLRDRDENSKSYDAKMHDSICSLGPAFFKQQCTLNDEGDEVYKKLQSARAKIKTDQEEPFYCAKKLTEITCVTGLDTLLNQLRDQGVYILPGEIETIIKDTTFLTPGAKLTGEKIYELFELLDGGKKPSEIFETDGFRSFLTHVLL